MAPLKPVKRDSIDKRVQSILGKCLGLGHTQGAELFRQISRRRHPSYSETARTLPSVKNTSLNTSSSIRSRHHSHMHPPNSYPPLKRWDAISGMQQRMSCARLRCHRILDLGTTIRPNRLSCFASSPSCCSMQHNTEDRDALKTMIGALATSKSH